MTGPRLFSILRQGANLIASIHTALDDEQLTRLQHDLLDRVGRDRARGRVQPGPDDPLDDRACAADRLVASRLVRVGGPGGAWIRICHTTRLRAWSRSRDIPTGIACPFRANCPDMAGIAAGEGG